MRPTFAKGVIDRSFMIKAIKGIPTYDIKEVLHPAYRRNDKLQKLHTNLNNLRKLLLVYRLVHFDDPIIDVNTGFEGRDKELCKPLLQLFYGTVSYGKIAKALKTFLVKKNKRKKNVSIEPVLYGIIVNMIPRYGMTISVADIWDEIRSNIGGVYDEKKPNEYQTFDYDTIYRSTITKIIEGFGAEREHKKHGNVMIFDQDKLVKAGKMYELGEGSEGNIDTLQPKNMEFHEGKVIQNCINRPDKVPILPSPPSPFHPISDQFPPKRYHCNIDGFTTKDQYERHVVGYHRNLPCYPGPADLEKHGLTPQGMPWEQQLPRNQYFEFEFGFKK